MPTVFASVPLKMTALVISTALLKSKGKRRGKNEDEDQAGAKAIHPVRYQDAEGPLQGTYAGVKGRKGDEALGGFAAPEGAIPRDRAWTPAIEIRRCTARQGALRWC